MHYSALPLIYPPTIANKILGHSLITLVLQHLYRCLSAISAFLYLSLIRAFPLILELILSYGEVQP